MDQMLDQMFAPMLAIWNPPGRSSTETPMQLPPPPPGLGAKEVEKWRKEMAKLVKLQHSAQQMAEHTDAKIMEQRRKTEEAMQRLAISLGAPAPERTGSSVSTCSSSSSTASATGTGAQPLVSQLQSMPNEETPLNYPMVSALDRAQVCSQLVARSDTVPHDEMSIHTSPQVGISSHSNCAPNMDACGPRLSCSGPVEQLLAVLSPQMEAAANDQHVGKAVTAQTGVVLEHENTGPPAWPGWHTSQRNSSSSRTSLVSAPPQVWAGWNEAQDVEPQDVEPQNMEGNEIADPVSTDRADCTFMSVPLVPEESPAPAGTTCNIPSLVIKQVPKTPVLMHARGHTEAKLLHRTPILLKNARSWTSPQDDHATVAVEAFIPDNVQAGDVLAVVHEGQQYSFPVPDGSRSGERITEKIHKQEGVLATEYSLEIVVPDGVQPGQLVQFEFNGQKYQASVPLGMNPGDRFMADISPPTPAKVKARLMELRKDPLSGPGDTQAVCSQQTAPGPTHHLRKHPTASLPGQPAYQLNPGVVNEFSYGVGMQFEYDAPTGNLCVYSIVPGLQCPFRIGDRLTEINGTNILSNPMLAPSLILGALNTVVRLRMIRDAEDYRVVESNLLRKQYDGDGALLVMKGGKKVCGIGVVLEIDPRSGLFFVKRVIEGGSAWAAGVQQYDTFLSIDGKQLKGLAKEALPSLIVGSAGTSIFVTLVPAGSSDPKQVCITRSVDTSRSQYSNAPTTVRCFLAKSCPRSVSADVVNFFETLHRDVYSALQTTRDRVEIPSQKFEGSSLLLCFMPSKTLRENDSRTVEELVVIFKAQILSSDSALKRSTAASYIESTQIEQGLDCLVLEKNPAKYEAAEEDTAPLVVAPNQTTSMPVGTSLLGCPLSPLVEVPHEIQSSVEGSKQTTDSASQTVLNHLVAAPAMPLLMPEAAQDCSSLTVTACRGDETDHYPDTILAQSGPFWTQSQHNTNPLEAFNNVPDVENAGEEAELTSTSCILADNASPVPSSNVVTLIGHAATNRQAEIFVDQTKNTDLSNNFDAVKKPYAQDGVTSDQTINETQFDLNQSNLDLVQRMKSTIWNAMPGECDRQEVSVRDFMRAIYEAQQLMQEKPDLHQKLEYVQHDRVSLLQKHADVEQQMKGQEIGPDQEFVQEQEEHAQHEARIQLVISPAPGSCVPTLEKNKFLAPSDTSVAVLTRVIRKRANLHKDTHLSVFFSGERLSRGTTLAAVYKTHRVKDKVLNIEYDIDNNHSDPDGSDSKFSSFANSSLTKVSVEERVPHSTDTEDLLKGLTYHAFAGTAPPVASQSNARPMDNQMDDDLQQYGQHTVPSSTAQSSVAPDLSRSTVRDINYGSGFNKGFDWAFGEDEEDGRFGEAAQSPDVCKGLPFGVKPRPDRKGVGPHLFCAVSCSSGSGPLSILNVQVPPPLQRPQLPVMMPNAQTPTQTPPPLHQSPMPMQPPACYMGQTPPHTPRQGHAPAPVHIPIGQSPPPMQAPEVFFNRPGMGPGSSTKKRRSSGGLGAFLDHAKKDFMEKVGGTPRDPWKAYTNKENTGNPRSLYGTAPALGGAPFVGAFPVMPHQIPSHYSSDHGRRSARSFGHRLSLGSMMGGPAGRLI